MEPDRKRLVKTILGACAIESACGAAVVLGGFGPCGPTNPIGFMGLLAHLPAILVRGPISTVIKLPSAAEIVGTAAIQIGVFAAIISAVRRVRIAARTA